MSLYYYEKVTHILFYFILKSTKTFKLVETMSNIRICKETGSTIVFRNVQNESIIKWDFSNGGFEAIVGDEVDIDTVFKSLIQTDLIENVSIKNRDNCKNMLKNVTNRYIESVNCIESQEKLIDELKTLFPNCTITSGFDESVSYSGFGSTSELISVVSDNNRGWGLYASETGSSAYIATTENMYNPVIFTNTGYSIFSICKKYTKAWINTSVRYMVERTIVYPEIGTDRNQLLDEYKNILYAEVDKKIAEAEKKSSEDILKSIVNIKLGDDISEFRSVPLHYVCKNPPF